VGREGLARRVQFGEKFRQDATLGVVETRGQILFEVVQVHEQRFI